MEAFMVFEVQRFEQSVNQMAMDQNFQPAQTRDVVAQETTEVAVVTKPAKKAALKKQSSFGRVLAATSKAVNPIFKSAGFIAVWKRQLYA